MFELLLAGQLFRRRVLCRGEQLLLTFFGEGSRQLKPSGQVSRFRAQNRTIDRFSNRSLSVEISVKKSRPQIACPDSGSRLVLRLSCFKWNRFGDFSPGGAGRKMRLLFVNSLAKSFSVPRAPCATDISWLVTGLVTVNGNRELCEELASFLDAMGSAELFRAADFSNYRPNRTAGVKDSTL